MELEPGTAFGRYQIVERLGAGGMAAVYKAFHPALDRVVAIKVIRADFTTDPEFLERFRAEAKAVARLRHPHIVQVHDFDVVEGRHFIVMEHVEGGSLEERLTDLAERGKWVSAREAVRIVSEIADGLSYAHGLGVLHRDVKPANVLLTREGRAVVSDFGLARIITSGGLTRTGTWVGTPEYMSPEQARGIGVDARSDVYSLGVVAYELFTRRRPYDGDSPLAIALSRMHDPLPPPRSIVPDIGVATERVIVTALALEPDERYQSATDLAAALAAAVAEDEGAAPSAPRADARVAPPVVPLPAAPRIGASAPAAAMAAAPAPVTPVATISISLPNTRSFAVVIAALIVVAAIAGSVAGRTLLGAGAPAASAAPSLAAGPPRGGAQGALDLHGMPLAQLPKGKVAYERASSFTAEDITLGPRTAASSVRVADGVVRLTPGELPAEVVVRGTARQVFIAEQVVFIDPVSDVRYEICVRMTAAQERYCFSMTRDATEFRYGSRERTETIAKGPAIAPWAGDKTLTVFVQLATFTLYVGDRVVLEAQDTRVPKSELDLGVGALTSGPTAGAATLRSVRIWELLPPK